MDLRYTEAEDEFRHELRRWLASVLPDVPPEPAPDDWEARRVWDTGWQKVLHDAGYAGINWPKEFGGRGATPTEHLIFLEETERARAPYVGMNFVGLLHAGPTLIVEPPRSRSQPTSTASCGATTFGARGSVSRAPAATLPPCVAGRSVTATTT